MELAETVVFLFSLMGGSLTYFFEMRPIFGNRYLVPIDGSEYFSSNKLHCPECLTQ